MGRAVVAGYVLLIIGILASLYAGFSLYNFIRSPPPGGGGFGAVLAVAFGALAIIGLFVLSGLVFGVTGSLLVRGHPSPVRKLFGLVYVILPVALGLLVMSASGAADPR
jgi:hypothetical protein